MYISLLSLSLALSPFASAAPASSNGGSSSLPSNPAPSGASTAPMAYETVQPVAMVPNYPSYPQHIKTIPQPLTGSLGASILGPQNVPLDRQNPDVLAPPTTDHGSVPNAKWSYGLSHNRMQTGGWARQQNVQNLPIATNMASVNMRLEAGATRELHWHQTAEWAIVLKGSTRITAVNTNGQIWVDTVGVGDLWYFPPGIPHSLQATNEDPDGTEFLLVFDDGGFSEDTTFQITDWMAHVPMEVLAKNFQLDMSAFEHIPSEELYIFPNAPPTGDAAPTGPGGTVPTPFTYHFSQVNATKLLGGSMKVVDTRTFPVATTIVGAIVTVDPGAMRELHWHPTQPEWSYFLEGTARMTIFAAQTNAQTFDFMAGDVGYVPPTYGHYVENTGNSTMVFMEIFNSDIVEDISLTQWLALTPPELVQSHIGLSPEVIAKLSKTKLSVV